MKDYPLKVISSPSDPLKRARTTGRGGGLRTFAIRCSPKAHQERYIVVK